jgi:outer membrane protein assembly factor BamA
MAWPAHAYAQQTQQAQAQAAPAAASSTLKSVAVEGSQRFTPEQLATAGGLAIGQAVTKESLQAAADELGRLGLFRKVQYRFKTYATGGVELVFELEDAPLLPVHFDNFPWFSDADLTERLKQAVVLFKGQAPSEGIILQDMTKALQSFLAEQSLTAAVENQVIARPDGTGDMLMFTVAGASLKIAGFEFQDPIAAESRRIAQAKQDLIGKAYSRYAIEMFLMEQVRPVYLDRGHIRVAFDTPRARFSGDPNKPLGDVTVAIAIQPGPVYRWGGVTWRGNNALDSAALDALVPLPAGQPANGTLITGAWLKVESEYGRRGYLDVKVTPQAAYDDAAHRVAYAVTLSEGVPYRMGELVITGLSVVAEQRIREAWGIAKGATFDRAYFEEFLDSGVKKAFADYVVHYRDIGRWLRTNPDARVVDVLLDFR